MDGKYAKIGCNKIGQHYTAILIGNIKNPKSKHKRKHEQGDRTKFIISTIAKRPANVDRKFDLQTQLQ